MHCSEVSASYNTPAHGTAVQVDYWLLIDYRGGWRAKAVNDNTMGDAVNQHLAALTQAVAERHGKKLRVLLIKQSDTAVSPPKVFLADGNALAPRMVTASLGGYDDLLSLSADDVVSLQFANGEPCDESLFLVCTNGQRDLCCGQFGMPLYRQLSEQYGARVWQCTHIGGHRFAPNILCLPTGLVYGFVSPSRALAVVDAMNGNNLTLDLLRGRSCFSAPAQAAEYFLRQQLNTSKRAAANSAITIESEVQSEHMHNEIAVTVSLDNRRHCVTLLSGLSPYALPASCGADEKPVKQFSLKSISTLGEC